MKTRTLASAQVPQGYLRLCQRLGGWLRPCLPQSMAPSLDFPAPEALEPPLDTLVRSQPMPEQTSGRTDGWLARGRGRQSGLQGGCSRRLLVRERWSGVNLGFQVELFSNEPPLLLFRRHLGKHCSNLITSLWLWVVANTPISDVLKLLSVKPIDKNNCSLLTSRNVWVWIFWENYDQWMRVLHGRTSCKNWPMGSKLVVGGHSREKTL